MISNAMDLVHENSIFAISLLQNRFDQSSKLMFLISTLFDPRYAFLFYAPILYSLDRYTGRKIMWVAVISEWSNQILKWILHGERPYWWIHETSVYNKTGLPDVQQFVITCETGPGSPSGHSMVTASVWYILIEAWLRHRSVDSTKSNLTAKLAWSFYTIILAVVSLSRVYIAAHFPHQCFLGGIIGVAVAMIISNLDTDSLSRRGYLTGGFGLFASAMATYVSLRALGVDPMWSVDRALKWCAKREYVHLDTTPFFSIMRYVGFFIGMGLGLTSSYSKSASKVKFTLGMKILSTILAFAVCKASEYIKIPMISQLFFYSSALLINIILPYTFVALIPYMVSKLSVKGKTKSK
ncbi:glucose-6-phosphatase 2-like [Panonychus citri]|uniref:glucose-6-phosphatase 2-like n=1 Tax=Panonychus citri TaxID=50023 RepID=UPI0023074C22|nr:glucose-6-phosphatase 2-like [Panonychus citri]